MAALYHFSVEVQTAKVIHACDLLTDMEETQGQRLKRLRKARGLTQKDLAKIAGLGQSAIGNIETDVRGYGAGIVEIAKALGTTAEYLQLKERQQLATSYSGVTENRPIGKAFILGEIEPPPYISTRPTDSFTQELVSLFSKLEAHDKREWLANLRGFVAGRCLNHSG